MLNKKIGLLTSYDQYYIQKLTKKVKHLKNKFALQIYTAQQLEKMLHQNGFTIAALYNEKGGEFSAKKSQGMLVVARKS
jgi:hypothetical protein